MGQVPHLVDAPESRRRNWYMGDVATAAPPEHALLAVSVEHLWG